MIDFPEERLGQQRMTSPIEMEDDMNLEGNDDKEKQMDNINKMSARMSHAAESV